MNPTTACLRLCLISFGFLPAALALVSHQLLHQAFSPFFMQGLCKTFDKSRFFLSSTAVKQLENHLCAIRVVLVNNPGDTLFLQSKTTSHVQRVFSQTGCQCSEAVGNTEIAEIFLCNCLGHAHAAVCGGP